jgi:hypothetical protein
MPPLFFLEAVQVAGFGPHTPADLLPIERLMRAANYSSRSISDALSFLDAGGDVAECESIDAGDKAEVRRLLPARLLPAIECWDGCAQCAEDAAIRHGLLRPTTTNTR